MFNKTEDVQTFILFVWQVRIFYLKKQPLLMLYVCYRYINLPLVVLSQVLELADSPLDNEIVVRSFFK